jgi:hypothetical protein
MLERSIVAVCFTHRSQPEYEFATNTIGVAVVGLVVNIACDLARRSIRPLQRRAALSRQA